MKNKHVNNIYTSIENSDRSDTTEIVKYIYTQAEEYKYRKLRLEKILKLEGFYSFLQFHPRFQLVVD